MESLLLFDWNQLKGVESLYQELHAMRMGYWCFQAVACLRFNLCCHRCFLLKRTFWGTADVLLLHTYNSRELFCPSFSLPFLVAHQE